MITPLGVWDWPISRRICKTLLLEPCKKFCLWICLPLNKNEGQMHVAKETQPILFRKHMCYEHRPCISPQRCLSTKLSLVTLQKNLLLSRFIRHAIIIVAPQSSTRTLPFLSQEQYRSVNWCFNCICHKLAPRQHYKCQVHCNIFLPRGNAIIKRQFGIILFPHERWHACYSALTRILTSPWLLLAAARCCDLQCCRPQQQAWEGCGGCWSCWDQAL